MDEKRTFCEENSTVRNVNIDFLRIMACSAVVGLHTLNKDASVANGFMYYLCGFAVPLFFMISGYLLLSPSALAKRGGGYSYKYAIHKALKIIRLIILWCIIFWLCDIATEILKRTFDISDFIKLPKAIIGGFIQKGLCWHFWYFGALILIYTLLSVFARLCEHRRAILLGAAVCICIGIQITSMLLGWPVQSMTIQTFRLWTWVAYFILGSFVLEILKRIAGNVSLKKHGVLLILFSLFIGVYQSCIGSSFILFQDASRGVLSAEYFYDDFFAFIWLLILFLFVMRLRLSSQICIIIEKVSRLTLGVYCGHQLVLKIIRQFLTAESLFTGILLWLLTLTISICVIYIIDKMPFGRFFIRM